MVCIYIYIPLFTGVLSVSSISGGTGFLPSTVALWTWDTRPRFQTNMSHHRSLDLVSCSDHVVDLSKSTEMVKILECQLIQ